MLPVFGLMEAGSMAILALVFLLCCQRSRAAGDADSSGGGERDDAFNREVLVCGPNSLFMFLILCGHDHITWDQVKIMPITSQGTSLLDLCDAAKKFGVEAQIREYGIPEIDSVPLPAIAYLRTSIASVTPFHFDIIYKIDSERLYLINGSTGSKYRMLRSRLPNFWTGYVMTEKRSRLGSVLNQCLLPALAAGLLTVETALLRLWSARKRRSAENRRDRWAIGGGLTSGVGRLVRLFVVFSAIAATLAAHGETGSADWRSPANGGVNVLYCYLRANGANIPYGELARRQREDLKNRLDAASLATLSTKSGLPIRPVVLTLEQLERAATPVIVHLDGETPESGVFILVLNVTRKVVYYVNGPSASIQSMSKDDFRRVWSGIGLLPVPPARQDAALCACGFGAGLILTVLARRRIARRSL